MEEHKTSVIKTKETHSSMLQKEARKQKIIGHLLLDKRDMLVPPAARQNR